MSVHRIAAPRAQQVTAVSPQTFAQAKAAAKQLGAFLKAKAKAFDAAAPQSASESAQLAQMKKTFGARRDASKVPAGALDVQTIDAKRFFYVSTKIDTKSGDVFQGTLLDRKAFFGPVAVPPDARIHGNFTPSQQAQLAELVHQATL
jgi:hypothetical protein